MSMYKVNANKKEAPEMTTFTTDREETAMDKNEVKVRARTTIQCIEWLCDEINEAYPNACTLETGDYDKEPAFESDSDLAFLNGEYYGPWCKVTCEINGGSLSRYGHCMHNDFESILGELRTIASFFGVSTTI